VALALAVAFALSSPAFAAGGAIPARYTCDGSNVSPPLRWTAPPRGTRTLGLTVVDPDAPGGHFVHWVASAIPATSRGLAVGARPPKQGANGAGGVGWTGPCPPAGPAHHYVFTLTALGVHGKVLARARLVGRYARR
jgi:Raf kinase inhibitor-like YbhB/YbcL family protein